MKDTAQIIKGVVDAMGNFKFNCTQTIAIGDEFKLLTCNTYWVRQDNTVTIGNKLYRITAVDLNKSITVAPVGHSTNPGTGELFDIPKPVYKHGTAMAVNAELSRDEQNKKTPLVWLYEPFLETIDVSRGSAIGLTTNIRLFVFDETNFSDFITEDHYHVVIRPMGQLIHEIIKHINNTPKQFNKTDEYTLTRLADWGEFNSMHGSEKKILDEDWSGIESKFQLIVKKEYICAC